MKLEVNQAIKVLEVDPKEGSLRSCHGGKFQWDPPILNEDGSWTPGAWTPSFGTNLCRSGYHLTDDPFHWWSRNSLGAFLVEFRGYFEGLLDSKGRKISVESCRLLRPLTATELAGYNVFTEGEHTIGGDIGTYVVAKNAFLYADCVSKVGAPVLIFAFDKSMVRALGNVVVRAVGNSDVYAYVGSRVVAYGNATVYAKGQVNVTAFSESEIYAYDGASIFGCQKARLTASNDVTVRLDPNFEGVLTRK